MSSVFALISWKCPLLLLLASYGSDGELLINADDEGEEQVGRRERRNGDIVVHLTTSEAR